MKVPCMHGRGGHLPHLTNFDDDQRVLFESPKIPFFERISATLTLTPFFCDCFQFITDFCANMIYRQTWIRSPKLYIFWPEIVRSLFLREGKILISGGHPEPRWLVKSSASFELKNLSKNQFFQDFLNVLTPISRDLLKSDLIDLKWSFQLMINNLVACYISEKYLFQSGSVFCDQTAKFGPLLRWGTSVITEGGRGGLWFKV